MTQGEFEQAYLSVMNELERKLKQDSRIKEFMPRVTVEKGVPLEEPLCPAIYISEGRITDVGMDTATVAMKIHCNLEYYTKSRNKDEGVTFIRNLTLKLVDTLIGTVNDRRLVSSGVSLANGPEGVKIVSADFGHFSPDNNSIIHRGVIELMIDVDVSIV